MSEFTIGTPGTLPFLSESDAVPGGYPVPAETRVATDQSEILGSGTSFDPLRLKGGGGGGGAAQAFEFPVSTFTDPNGFDVALPVAMPDGAWIPTVIGLFPTVDDFTDVFVLSRTATTLRLGALQTFVDGTILLITINKATA